MVNYLADLKKAVKWSNLNIGYNLDISFYNNRPTLKADMNGIVSNVSNGNVPLTAQAFNAWSNILPLNFIPTSQDKAQLGILTSVVTDTPSFQMYGMAKTYFSAGKFTSAAIFIESKRPVNDFIHEIGHILGLDHPGHLATGEMKGYSWDTTIMSYNAGSLAGYKIVSPMIYDIAAAQSLYNSTNRTDIKDTTYNASNALYPINGSKVAMTIWDAGGTDTFDASAIAGNHLIDLRGGVDAKGKVYFSKIGDEKIAIAFDPAAASKVVDIENGFGGAGMDTIYGGYANNLLKGNGGADTIVGWGGNDTIYGGEGNDSLYAYKQASGEKPLNKSSTGVIYGDAGNDTIIGDNGNDTIYGGADNDSIKGGNGNNVIYGESGNDIITTAKGNSFIDGGLDNDSIQGAKGNDFILGGYGEDSISGGAGNDTLDGGPGQDAIVGGPGDDTILITSSSDWVDAGSGYNTINIVRDGFVTDPLPVGAYSNIPSIHGSDGVIKFDGKVLSGECDLDNGRIGDFYAYFDVGRAGDGSEHRFCPGSYILVSESPNLGDPATSSASHLAVYIAIFWDGEFGLTFPADFWD